jgi:flagellar hook-associated protein 3 FlgL
MIGRVATFSQSLYLLNQSLGTQARLADAQAQTASGLKSATFGGLGVSAGALTRQQTAYDTATAQSAAATGALTVLQQSWSALGTITDLTDAISTTLASAVSANDTTDLAATAQGWLSDLQSILNGQFSDRSLFAGTATDATAVNLTDYVSGAATSYYTGSTDERVFTAADGQTVALSTNAANSSLATLVDALKGLINGTSDAATALDGVQTAASSVADLQAGLSTGATRLQAIADRADAKASALSDLISTLKDADLAEASVLATQYETQLQTAYSTLNMLMSVKLSDYLR